MNDIKCPHCQKAFKVDEAGFADILKQVRDTEFAREMHEREQMLERDKENAVRLAEEKAKNELQAEAAKKDAELAVVKSQMQAIEADKQNAIDLATEKTKNELAADVAKRDADIAELRAQTAIRIKELEAEATLMSANSTSQKDAEMADLKSKLQALETEKKLAISQAIAEAEKERSELAAAVAKRDAELAELKAQSESKLKELEAESNLASARLASQKDAELAEIKAKLQAMETEKKLELTEAVTKIEKERDEIASKLTAKDSEHQLIEVSLKDKYENELRSKDEMIVYYKDMKAKLSTKMVGETLEQHCEIEFEKLRATGFKNAEFGKDNDASSGSKGDYIYRETDDEGNELISIMFEMKNEGDETATKKKNEDFFRELDKDRSEKKCEYAVLVSLLEADHELYNAGIVDVSHKHDKMYVVRPQFFMPIITVLRNAALNSMRYKSELALIRSQNVDITNFENDLQVFQDGFMKNVKDFSNKFQDAMDGIDSTIKKLESVKEALRLSNKHLLTAGSKVDTVLIKRLTANNPTMATKFADLNKD